MSDEIPTGEAPTEPPRRRRRPFRRSPGYPAITLERAIERARQMYARERQHATPVLALAHIWGYKSLNGPAAQALAALKRYGLVVVEGSGDARTAAVSDLAVTILEHPDPEAVRRAIREAALKPPVHQELWDEYKADLPSDTSLNWKLTRERGFTEAGAQEFIPQYRQTIAFAGLDGAGVSSPPLDVKDEHDEEDEDRRGEDQGQAQIPPSADQTHTPGSPKSAPAPPTAPGASTWYIPLIGGSHVMVQGPFPIGEQDWQQFLAVLTAMKPGLVRSAESPNPPRDDAPHP